MVHSIALGRASFGAASAGRGLFASGESIGRITQPHWVDKLCKTFIYGIIDKISRQRVIETNGVAQKCRQPVTPLPMLTPAQLRAARAIVGWSREDLAEKSGMSPQAIREFELGSSDPKMGTVQKWRRAIEQAGVQFIDADETGGPGVRLRSMKAKR